MARWRTARGQTVPNEETKFRFKLVTFDQIEMATSAAYLVRDIIPREGLVVIWGPPKCAKIFWTFDIAMHVALGWEYRGRRVKQGVVVYIACEGERGLGARAEAFRRSKLSEDSSVPEFHLLATRLDLVADHKQLIEDIRGQVGDVLPAAVVVDTLNRSMAGSESSDEDMGAYVKAADTIREAFKCAVIIIHHSGIDDKRPRGHTSLTGAADAQIAIRRGSDGLITSTVEWMKDGAEGGETSSRLEVVDLGTDDDGEPITSCVVVETSAAEGVTPKRPKLTARQKQAMDVLRNCQIDIGTQSPGGSNYPTGIRLVEIDQWREALTKTRIIDPDGSNPRQEFKRLCRGLQDRSAARIWGDYVWPAA